MFAGKDVAVSPALDCPGKALGDFSKLKQKVYFDGPVCVFGVPPTRPISNLPEDTIKVRIRLRCSDVGCAFVRRPDCIEKYLLLVDGDNWKLNYFAEKNITLEVKP